MEPQNDKLSFIKRLSAKLAPILIVIKKPWFIWVAAGFVLIVGGLIIFLVVINKSSQKVEFLETNTEGTQAIEAGQQLASNKCSGSGSVELTALPMRQEDYAMIIPYGMVVGAHVTPIDHQYFMPTNFHSSPDTYEVYAMADGRITEIARRIKSNLNPGQPPNDYRLVFSHTCTFLTYFDLVTSLAPDIQAEFDKYKNSGGGQEFASLDIPVKAGQLVGYIGGQTLDFAVWDTQKPLTGFVSPELYKSEPWKIYTADPLDYYTDEIKTLILAKYLRNDAGKSGKIDWDKDGYLIGNWFLEGANGYAGSSESNYYYASHLSIAPDHVDNSGYIASFGAFQEPGDGKQYIIYPATPSPAEVTSQTGLVKYQLYDFSYLNNDGSYWDRLSYSLNPKIIAESNSPTRGCLLVQLVANRQLQMEVFPSQECAQVNSFTSSAKNYTR